MRSIPFSPPDITESEINAVVEVLKSGWITTGPKVKEFEKEIAEYCNSKSAVAVSSATMAMELLLKVMDIKEGDEIISTPYTYASTSNVAVHRGIKPTLVDVKKDSFLIDYDKIEAAITDKTKVIMPVDIAGMPCDYHKIKKILRDKNREDIIILCDSAHSFGAKYKGEHVGTQCDYHSFSFHPVKNLTTGEGGVLTFSNEEIYKELKYTSLNGQTKDAMTKLKAGAWEYDIVTDGLKCNMPDMNAAIGLAQLKRYSGMLHNRKKIFNLYNNILKDSEFAILPKAIDEETNSESSYHLYLLRLRDFSEEKRNKVIEELAEKGIPTNVHYKPLPLLSLYKNLGYDIKNYPNAFNQYKNEITLPLYSTLKEEDAIYIAEELIKVVKSIK